MKSLNRFAKPSPVSSSPLQSGYFSRCPAPSRGTDNEMPPAPEKGSLMHLCHEIAGALLRHHAEGREAAAARSSVAEGLVEVLEIDSFQAHRLIDLAVETIRVTSYGSYRRNPVELSLLIAQAGGALRDVGEN